MKIVVTDGYTLNPGDNPWDEIEALGELTVYDRTDPSQLMDRISEAGILVVNKTPLRQETLNRLPKLKFIAVTATGFDILDIEAASDPFRGQPPPYRPFQWLDLKELFSRADFISLNCNQNNDSVGFVNRDLLGRMKPEAFLINTSRGGLIHESDLAEALNAGRIAGAALDVVSEEPIRPDNPLRTAKNIILTPHIAWAAREARRRLMQETVENVKAFLWGNPRNVVNPSKRGDRHGTS